MNLFRRLELMTMEKFNTWRVHSTKITDALIMTTLLNFYRTYLLIVTTNLPGLLMDMEF